GANGATFVQYLRWGDSGEPQRELDCLQRSQQVGVAVHGADDQLGVGAVGFEARSACRADDVREGGGRSLQIHPPTVFAAEANPPRHRSRPRPGFPLYAAHLRASAAGGGEAAYASARPGWIVIDGSPRRPSLS